MKILTAQQHCVQICYTDFHPNRPINVDSMDRNLFAPVCKAWGSVVVKVLRYKSEGPGIDSKLGIYSVAADISMCPGVDSASKNEYQDTPGGKGGRCVRVTTLPPSCAECLVIWSLN